MAIHGPLRELGIHDVFQLLDLGKKTGRLRVTSELRHNEGTIWFHQAAVVGASIKSNPNLLGRHLVKAGKIAPEDLARAQGIQAAGDRRRIGEIFVSIGAISAKELHAQVRAQIEEVVFTILAWSEGHFIFEEVDPEAIPRDTDIRISVEALLLEAARRIDEWSSIRAKVPHLGVVPRIAPSPQTEPGSLTLTPFEWRVLAACDGSRDLQSCALALNEPEFDVARAAFGLASAGVIVIRDPLQESAQATSREDLAPLLAEAERQIQHGNLDGALTVARSAISSYPEDPRGHLLLGKLLLGARRYSEAEIPLREAIRLDPASPRGLRLLSWALLGAGRLEEAVHGFEAWLSLPLLGREEEAKVTTVGAAIPAARQLADLLRGAHE